MLPVLEEQRIIYVTCFRRTKESMLPVFEEQKINLCWKNKGLSCVTRVGGTTDYLRYFCWKNSRLSLLPVLEEQRIIYVTRVGGTKDYLCYPCWRNKGLSIRYLCPRRVLHLDPLLIDQLVRDGQHLGEAVTTRQRHVTVMLTQHTVRFYTSI